MTLDVPSDVQRVLAVAFNRDPGATSDDETDDGVRVIGVGSVPTPAEVASVTLDLATGASLARVDIGGPPDVAGWLRVIGVPGLSVDGTVALYPRVEGASFDFAVPLANTQPEGTLFWGVSLAATGGNRTESYSRGLSLPTESGTRVDVGALGVAPTLRAGGASRTFTLEGTGALAHLRARAQDGASNAWEALIFEGATSVALPPPFAFDPTSMPLRLTRIDVPSFDATDFDLAALKKTLRGVGSVSPPLVD